MTSVNPTSLLRFFKKILQSARKNVCEAPIEIVMCGIHT